VIGLIRLAGIVAASVFSAISSTAQSLDGVWRSQGYGLVFEIEGSKLRAFEVTTRTCVPSFQAKRESGNMPDREATFRTADGDVYFIRTGGGADHKLLHNDGAVSDMRMDRLQRLPEVCDHPTPNTPLDNFEVFTRTWAENYISFDLKQVDWEKVVAENRGKVTAATTPAELFQILKGMIEPFGDAHSSLRAPRLKQGFQGFRPGTDRKSAPPELLAITRAAYLHGPLREFCNGKIQYGHIDDHTGYLRIISFSGFGRTFAAGMTALESALDNIFSDSALQSLVIDVRINFGGYDPYGLAIASRLATSEYLAYAKEARADPVDHNKWTPSDASIVKRSSRPGFRGLVVELMGPSTISAGETFTQALMGRTPHITRIGENTQGVFSDVLGRSLPNGWLFGLPNEVYRTSDGRAFDGAGIPPDISVPVFAAADVAAGKDPAMARGLEVLRGAR